MTSTPLQEAETRSSASAETPYVTVYTEKHKIPFLIDADDLEAVSHYTWGLNPGGYVITRIGKGRHSPNSRNISLHLFLLGPAGDGLVWDHINRNILDNRRSNLRAATRTTNSRNRKTGRNNRSGIAGVHWDKRRKRWVAKIAVANKPVWLGHFKTIEAAVAARQAGVVEHWAHER